MRSACISELSRWAMMMRDPVAAVAAHRCADPLLGGGVDGGGRVVEHHHGRLQHQRPGDGQPLALAARQRDAALADDRAVVLRKAEHVVVQLRRFARPLDARLVGPGIAVGDVVLERGGEQEGVLLHHRDRPAQRLQRDAADVLAVDGDAPRCHVVEARDQVRDRRLAAAGRADDADGLAAARLEADAGERRAPEARIGEVDVLEAQHARRSPRAAARRGRRRCRRRGRAARRGGCRRSRRGRTS